MNSKSCIVPIRSDMFPALLYKTIKGCNFYCNSKDYTHNVHVHHDYYLGGMTYRSPNNHKHRTLGFRIKI